MKDDLGRQLLGEKTTAREVFDLLGPEHPTQTEEMFLARVAQWHGADYVLGRRPVFWDSHKYTLEIGFDKELTVISTKVVGD